VLPAPVAEFPESVVFAEAPDLASTLSMLPDVQYYETTAPLSEQPYLLPVFVFSGTAQGLQEEEEFVLIVPALAARDRWSITITAPDGHWHEGIPCSSPRVLSK